MTEAQSLNDILYPDLCCFLFDYPPAFEHFEYLWSFGVYIFLVFEPLHAIFVPQPYLIDASSRAYLAVFHKANDYFWSLVGCPASA